jgi:hypothetical protein
MRTDPQDPAHSPDPEKGLTKREYFAALAMQAILSDPEEMESEDEAEDREEEEEGEEMGEGMENGERKYYGRKDGETCIECCCRVAVEHADELIRALNK